MLRTIFGEQGSALADATIQHAIKETDQISGDFPRPTWSGPMDAVVRGTSPRSASCPRSSASRSTIPTRT